MNQIKTVFGFDMETDIGSWTSFYEGFKHGTPLILDVLKKHDIKATFFFTGDSARKNPEIVHMVRDAGHEIGCHTLFDRRSSVRDSRHDTAPAGRSGTSH